MKRKTAGELAEFFAAMPKEKPFIFIGVDYNGEKIEISGQLKELEGCFYVVIKDGRYIDDLWYRVQRTGTDLDEEL